MLAEKRRDEELKQTLKEYSDAKTRMEVEIQRKKEHQNFGSNFEARGFVRSNWRTKNFNPENNPLSEESSTDSEEYGEEMLEDVDEIAQPLDNNKTKGYSEEKEDDLEDEEEEEDVTEIRREVENQNSNNRQAKSAHPRARGRNLSGVSQPTLHDLTKDQVGYGLRPSTAV